MNSTQVVKTKANYSEQSKSDWTKWIIAITVSVAALLEVVDMSIVNVALTQIQGNLGATLSEVGWIVTGYAIANGIMIPLSAWLSDFFGKKNYFVFSLIGFTLSSCMCGMAPNLITLIIARIIQGLCGGGLLAKAQAILFETFPLEEQGAAQGIFGLCVMIGPILGPTLGGYLTDTFNWRMIFFINIPIGILATLMAIAFLPLSAKKSSKIDWPGIILLITTIGCLQTVLEDGQKNDWFSSQYILLLTVITIVSLILFVWRELIYPHPAVDLKVLRFKSLAAGSIFSLGLGMSLYGAMFAVPIFAQNIMHYTSMQTGLLLVPGAIASTLMMPIFAKLTGKVDARILIAIGGILSIISIAQLASMNVNTNADTLFYPLVIRGVASIFMFMPLSTATLGSLPKEYIGAGSGFFSLTRQLGGSIGIALLTTILDQRVNFHRSMLCQHINSFNPTFIEQAKQIMTITSSQSSSLPSNHIGSLSLMNNMINMQATILSFSDSFYVVAIIFLCLLPLLIFLDSGKKKPIIEAH